MTTELHPVPLTVPGLFYYLARDGKVDLGKLDGLLAILPEERFVQTAVRGGEAFDSTRWPVARDAALAAFAARRHPDPEGHLQATQAELDAGGGDPEQLRPLARRSAARALAAIGADATMLTAIWRDATEEDLAVVAAPSWPPETAACAAALAAAHYQAADGLFAYHVHRHLPGPSAEAAAAVVARALDADRLTVDALVDEAIRLSAGRPADLAT